MSEQLQFTKLDPLEESRIYIFPNGETVALKNVIAICVRPSGTHRLETADGLKHIISPGWLSIVIKAVAWTL